MQNYKIITIDGPVASGKSTIALALAHRLGFMCIYSGYLYRALAYALIHKAGYSPENLHEVSKDTVVDWCSRLHYLMPDGKPQVLLGEQDVTAHLKEASIDAAASIIGTNQAVREVLTDMQRVLACDRNVVVEGRDAGAAVFPDADCKIFLTASEDERAVRWQRAQQARGVEYTLAECKRMLHERDQRDAARTVAPLECPVGACVIDSTGMTIDTVIDHIEALCLKK